MERHRPAKANVSALNIYSILGYVSSILRARSTIESKREILALMEFS